MQIFIFTLNAVLVYIFSDWLLRTIERRLGRVLKQRQAIFFIIFLVLIMVSFEILNRYFASLQPSL